MLKFHIITLFPELIETYTKESIIGRAMAKKHLAVKTYNPRDFTNDKHYKVDARPFSGGPGMVLQAEPILKTVDHIKKQLKTKPKIFIFSPRGKQFDNLKAKALVKKHTDFIFICGRYEGIDARVKKILKAEELSIGPYVLTGGELPALVVLDSIARQKPGVLGEPSSLEEGRSEVNDRHLVYTRPASFKYQGKEYKVPPVLLSGNPAKIAAWYRRLKGDK